MRSEDSIIQRFRQLILGANALLAQQRDIRTLYGNVPGVDFGQFTGWSTQARSALYSVLGESHPYTKSFTEAVTKNYVNQVSAGVSILTHVVSDLERGYLRTLHNLVSAEVFDDFLEMAAHLLDNGYKDPAAMPTGATLESGLRRLAQSKPIALRGDENLATLSQKCADGGVYNRLKQRQVQVWIATRNHADHGDFDAYSNSDVEKMIREVREFLGQYLS